MNVLRGSCGFLAAVLAAATFLLPASWSPPVRAQVPDFDRVPSGFLTPTTGGMPADAWSGTALATAKRLVSALPAAPRSRALRDLQFKVLVSQLNAPSPDGSPPPGLFARKVDRLAAMGEAENLNEMVRSVGAYAEPALAATTVNALMMAGEKASACQIVRTVRLSEPFERRADTVCKLVAGDNAGALSAALPLKSGDPAFYKLVEIAAEGLSPTAPPPAQLDGPAMVLLDLAFVQPSAATLRTTQPPLMRSLVAHRTLPVPTRLEIAERGEALAIVEASKLGDLYLDAVRDKVVLPAPMTRRARLVAAARGAQNAQQLISAIATVYGEERGGPLFPTIARASAGALMNVAPKPEYAGVAQEVMRGLLLLGDRQQTRAWTRLALSAAFNDARAMGSLERLLPLMAIAGVDDAKRLPPEDINRWYELIARENPAQAQVRGYLLLELFRAIGFDIPARSTTLPETPGNARLVSPPAATMQALQAAGTGKRRAEAAVLSSVAIGETPLIELHPAAAGAIVRALRQVGEDHAGRLFAVEIAIAHGL